MHASKSQADERPNSGSFKSQSVVAKLRYTIYIYAIKKSPKLLADTSPAIQAKWKRKMKSQRVGQTQHFLCAFMAFFPL